MSQTIRRLIWFAVLLPVAVAIAAAVVLASQVAHLSSLDAWVTHSEQVIGEIRHVQKLMLDEETAVRGYLLAQQPQFLKPYDDARASLEPAFDHLAQLVADSPSQAERTRALRAQHEVWHRDLAGAIAQVRAGHAPLAPPSAEFVAALEARKARMDGVRGVVAAGVSEEEQLLQDRRERAHRQLRVVIVGGGAFLILFGVAIAVIVRRNIHRITTSYQQALDDERETRRVAEALAAEVREQSLAVEKTMRDHIAAREVAEQKLARLEHEAHETT